MEEQPLPRGRGAWFEGWYFKHQGENGGLALIPAIHRQRKGEWTASLQIITPWESRMVCYPIEAFTRGEELQIRLGESWFSQEGICLKVDEPGLSLRGELRYGPLTVPREDIMGPFRHVPHMQCVHGICSMGHRVDGAAELNGKALYFDKGRGYWETDRGRSFPRRYLWTQCSWQERQRVSLMLAIAHIPVGLGSFTGIICQIIFAGRPIRLATYQGAKVDSNPSNPNPLSEEEGIRKVLFLQEVRLYAVVIRKPSGSSHTVTEFTMRSMIILLKFSSSMLPSLNLVSQ